MLLLQLERLQRACRVDEIVVATSTEHGDDAIARACETAGVFCHRGSLDDVLARFTAAAKLHDADIVLRLTADCPLTDPLVVDGLVAFLQTGGFDYASNTLKRSWPHGLDVEAMTIDALVTAAAETTDPFDREHVTPVIYHNPDRFKLGAYTDSRDLSEFRLTVDYREDFDVVTRIYDALYDRNPAFTTADVVTYLEANPDIRALNHAHIVPQT